MTKLSRQVMTFLHAEDGPTAVEYAVMMALIIVVCVLSISTLGSNNTKSYVKVGNTVNTGS